MILFCLLSVELTGNMVQSSTNGVTDFSANDWDDVKQISDSNRNATNSKIIKRNDGAIHSFWNSYDENTNISQIVYNMYYEDSTNLENCTLYEFNWTETGSNAAYIQYDVIFDSSDRLHIVYNDEVNGIYHQYSKGFTSSGYVLNDPVYICEEADPMKLSSDDFGKIFLFYLASDHLTGIHLYYQTFSSNSWIDPVCLTSNLENGCGFFTGLPIAVDISKKGNIFVLYKTPTSNDIFSDYRLSYSFYNGKIWSESEALTDAVLTYAYDVKFDDSDKLHLLYSNMSNTNYLYYLTFKGEERSTTQEIELFNSTIIPNEKRYCYICRLDVTVIGSDIMIAVTLNEFLWPGFDYDLLLLNSTDGQNWTIHEIATNDEIAHVVPAIVCTKDGDVYIISDCTQAGDLYSKKYIYLSTAKEFFTYKRTRWLSNYQYQLLFIVIPIVIIIKKRREK